MFIFSWKTIPICFKAILYYFDFDFLKYESNLRFRKSEISSVSTFISVERFTESSISCGSKFTSVEISTSESMVESLLDPFDILVAFMIFMSFSLFMFLKKIIYRMKVNKFIQNRKHILKRIYIFPFGTEGSRRFVIWILF